MASIYQIVIAATVEPSGCQKTKIHPGLRLVQFLARRTVTNAVDRRRSPTPNFALLLNLIILMFSSYTLISYIFCHTQIETSDLFMSR